MVEFAQEALNVGIEFMQREESKMAKSCQDPALNDLNSDFHFCFVPRFAHPGGDDSKAIVSGHLLIGGAEIWLITGGLCDAALEIVRDDQFRNTLHESQDSDKGVDPVRQ